MTGKDEWRLIHADGAGNPIDSKVQKPKNAAQSQEKSVNTLTGPGYQVGGAPPEGTAAPPGVQDVAMRQRATDRMPVPGTAEDAAPADGAPPIPGEQQQNPPVNSEDATNPVGPPVPNANGEMPNGVLPVTPNVPTGLPQQPNGFPMSPGMPGTNQNRPGAQPPNSAQAAAPTYGIGGGAGIGGGGQQAQNPGQTAAAPHPPPLRSGISLDITTVPADQGGAASGQGRGGSQPSPAATQPGAPVPPGGCRAGRQSPVARG